MSGADDGDVFEAPSRWRLVAARALGLEGEDLIAGVTTGAAYPVAIEPVVAAIGELGEAVVLDVGSGSGGVAEWIASRTGARMVGLEPSSSASTVAAATFTRVEIVRGAAESLPFRRRTFDAVTLLGAVSLVADLDRLLDEVFAVLRPGGLVGISDLCLDDGREATEAADPNTFRSLATLVRNLRNNGFVVDDVAAGAGHLTTRWSSVIRCVDDEIEQRFSHHPAFRGWTADRDHIRRRIEAGDLSIGTLVARRAS